MLLAAGMQGLLMHVHQPTWRRSRSRIWSFLHTGQPYMAGPASGSALHCWAAFSSLPSASATAQQLMCQLRSE